MRILVVEDESDIRSLLGEVLVSLGHEPFLAENTAKATEMLALTKPQMILLDLLVEGTLATPFIQVVRDMMRPPPRIIIVSAMNKVKNVAESNDVEFLKKPFNLEELEELVGKKDVQSTNRRDDRKADEFMQA